MSAPNLTELFRNALIEYGCHAIECGVVKDGQTWRATKECTCGFHSVLQAARYLSSEPLTEVDIQRTRELAEKLGWPKKADGKQRHSDKEITEAMVRLGGSFVARLSIAFCYADPNNQQRIKRAFPEYWRAYDDLAGRTDDV